MAVVEPRHIRGRSTHEVLNQPPPLADYNLFENDAAMRSAVAREGADWAQERLTAFGERVGGEPLEWGRLANRHLPVLHTHDAYGNRIDEVEFHPAWHSLLRLGIENEVHSLPWNDSRPGAHVARAALMMMLSQAEAGVMCPISMTYSVIPALEAEPELAAEWRPRLTLPDYDRGARGGMALTEKQGGSDVGANTTIAYPSGSGEYELTGHKWFCSHPVCDVFLLLARTPGQPEGSRGLSCFLLPRRLEDGALNGIEIMALKDKLGTRALATGEVELEGALAYMVGEEGRGVATIMEMVNHTRLDCTLGSAAAMRAGVAQATHHAAHREAFGKLLIDQPAMQNVLADLCVEAEAATTTALRLARAYDDPDQAAFRRLATAVAKYFVCKRAPEHAVEALECLGGNGYVEDSDMPRLFRDSQVNSVWEGSGNVIALDALRAMAKEPESMEAFVAELEAARGADGRLDAAIDGVREQISSLGEGDPQLTARRLVERMALALEGCLLVRAAGDDPGAEPVVEAFLVSRLGGDWGHQFGTLPAGTDCPAIIDRHRPRLGS